jgi:hypothetical protein
VDNQKRDLSDIYHEELQDDKLPFSIHESPYARVSRAAPLLRSRIYGLGTRPFVQLGRLPAYLGLSRTARDPALSRCHHIPTYRLLSRPRFGYLDTTKVFFWILGYSADLGRLRTCPLFVISREEAGRETRGPHVVQVSREPCATKLDKAGEHVV